MENCEFEHNSAKISGGAVFYSCDPGFPCSFQIKKSHIVNNSAIEGGGGIFWDMLEPSGADNTF